MTNKSREMETGIMAFNGAIIEARDQHRPHSLIASKRTWQKVASAPSVAAWGYAYENGQFHRDTAIIRAFPCSACQDKGNCSVCRTL